MRVPDSSLVTETQHTLVVGALKLLDAVGASYAVSMHESGEEAWYRIRLFTAKASRLLVELYVAIDSFQFNANGADLRYQLLDAGDDGDRWVSESLQILEALLGQELRIRVHRKLTGGHTGAVWVPSRSGGHWNGELLAVLGLGRERRYPEWWRPPGAEGSGADR